MSKMSNLSIDDQNIDTYLNDSTYFEEFYEKANSDIYEHLLETNGGKIPLEDDVKDYAKEMWDEFVDGQMPF